MRRTTIQRHALALMTGLLLATRLAAPAHAVPLSPGTGVALGGTTAAARPELVGVTQHDKLIPFQITDGGGVLLYEGTLQNRVVRSNLDHTLDFYYVVRDTVGGLNGILQSARTHDFGHLHTDVDYRTDTLPAKPTTRAQRDPGPGHRVELLYGNSVFSGEESLPTFIKTDAYHFTDGGKTVLSLQGGYSVVLDTVQPVIPGDFDGDGDVDAFDLGIWQTGFGTRRDVGDGVVDAADYTIWRSFGDADADLDVDAFDLGLWQTHFGAGRATPRAIPEPASLALIGLGTLLIARRRA